MYIFLIRDIYLKILIARNVTVILNLWIGLLMKSLKWDSVSNVIEKKTVRQEERWLIINYLRTFKKTE